MTQTKRMQTRYLVILAAMGVTVTAAVVTLLLLTSRSNSDLRAQADVTAQADRYLTETLDAAHYTGARTWGSYPNVCSPLDTSHQSLDVAFAYPGSVPVSEASTTLATIAKYWDQHGYGKAVEQTDMQHQVVGVDLHTNGFELNASWQGGQLNVNIVTPCYTPSTTTATPRLAQSP